MTSLKSNGRWRCHLVGGYLFNKMPKILPAISIRIKTEPIPQEESDRVLFAFFDILLNEEWKENHEETKMIEQNKLKGKL